MSIKKGKKQIGIGIFFLALFLSYFSGITFFTHQHVIDGEVVVHSHFIKHPFSRSQSQLPDHSHNTQSFHLIASVSSWISDFIEQSEFSHELWLTILSELSEHTVIASSIYLDNYFLRGPPQQRISIL